MFFYDYIFKKHISNIAAVFLSCNMFSLSPQNSQYAGIIIRELLKKPLILLDYGKHYNAYKSDNINSFVVKIPNSITDYKVLQKEYETAKPHMEGIIPPMLKFPSPDKRIYPAPFIIIQPFLIGLNNIAKNWQDLFYSNPEKELFKNEIRAIFFKMFSRGIFWYELPKLENFAYDPKTKKVWIIDFGEPELVSSDSIFRKIDEAAPDRRFWRKDSGNYVLIKFPQELGFILDSCNMPSDSDIKKIWGENKGLHKVESFELASDSENFMVKNLTGLSL